MEKDLKKIKVIFLDFDGVLNSQGSFLYEENRRERGEAKGPINQTFCNVCTANFQLVLDTYPELKVVISSTWRNLFDLPWLKAKFEEYHLDSSRIIGITPDVPFSGRGIEINSWLADHPEVVQYAIVDDNDDGISVIHGHERFVKTTWDGGLTFDKALELKQKISNRNKTMGMSVR